MEHALPITVTPIHVADLAVEGETMPVYVHLIDHPAGRVLVDTGFTELHPAVADMDPTVFPLNTHNLDLGSIVFVVNTHLHFDHCGGNHLFAGTPVYVQRAELDEARSRDDYTIREWVDAPGVEYVAVDGELELLPGLRIGARARPPRADLRSWCSTPASGPSSSQATPLSGVANSTNRRQRVNG